jgi:hypothetical protein
VVCLIQTEGLIDNKGEERMSDFDTWFRKQTGEDTESCNWLTTFMRSNNADEVERIFQEHYRILIADEMIEELNGTVEIMKSRLPHPGALTVIGMVRDRLALIGDTRRFDAQKAIERHKRRAAFEQNVVSNKWFSTFMTSNDPDEVAQLFRDHQNALLTDEAVETLKGMIAGYKDYGMNLRAIQATVETEDRLALIEDTQRFTIGEAIRRYKVIAACRQKVDHFRDARKFRKLTPAENREADDALQAWGRALMGNSPEDPTTPRLINIYPDRLEKATYQFGQAADWYRDIDAGDQIAETFFRRALIEEKRMELGLTTSDCESLRYAYKIAIDKAITRKPYYQTKLDEFLKRCR